MPARNEPVHSTGQDYDKLTKTFFAWCNVCRWTANRIPDIQTAKKKRDAHTANPKAR